MTRVNIVAQKNPAWAELIQLVPVISLAFPFILRGKVDLSQAGSGFLVAACLAIPVIIVVAARGHLLNPILVGTSAWIGLGAVAFHLPVPELADWFGETQAFGLFAAALVAGIVATYGSPHGYVACRSTDPVWVRRTSMYLLLCNIMLLVWAWVYRHDVRLGGGLPFILLNVARRVMARSAPTSDEGLIR